MSEPQVSRISLESRVFAGKLAVLVLVINAFAVILAGLALQHSHGLHVQRAAAASQNLAHILEKHFATTIEAIDDALLAVVDEVERQNAQGRRDGDAVQAVLDRRLRRMSAAQGLRVTDSIGHIVHNAGVAADRSGFVGDRAYFLQSRDDPQAGLVMSAPVYGRLNGTWVVVFARRLNDAQGHFAGIVYAPVPVDEFSAAISALDLGPRGAVAVRDASLAVIARYPATSGGGTVIGSTAVSDEMREAVASHPQGGTYTAHAALDGVERTLSYRKIGDRPLYVLVGLATADYLADWQRELWVNLILLGLFLPLTAAAAAWIFRAWREKGRALERAGVVSARLQAVLTNTPIGLVIVDQQRCIREANGALADMFGIHGGALCGQSTQVLYASAEEFAELGRRAYPVVERGETFSDVVMMRRASGGEFWCRLIGGMVDQRAPELGYVWIFEDITEQRRAEADIRRLLSYQQAILANTPVGIAIVGLDRTIMHANEAFCRIYGRDGETLTGRPASILYADPAQHEAVGNSAYPVICAGGTFSGDVLMSRRDGSKIWVRLVAHLVDVDQPELGVAWAAEDISTLKELNESLLRSNADLERFAYVASHDLRQPLRMISSYIGLIQRRLGGALDGEIQEFMGYVTDGAQRMDRMIVDLLDYSRIARRGGEIQPVALADAVARARDSLAHAILDARAEIVVAGDLPVVNGSASELERLFQNLIGNALKFRTPDVAPHIEIGCRAGDGEWIVSVRDNGIGIDPADFDRLFTLFSRLVPQTRYEGTGIGLAACRKIAEHHGGRIWVDSEPGRGSTFHVALAA
ncbi:MAG: PAS domain S-box protein [Magnetospirillum sp.]|nr:PAS domain S-box protein [Magnetospirillum sp.]